MLGLNQDLFRPRLVTQFFLKYSKNTAVFKITTVLITMRCLAATKNYVFNTALFAKPRYYLCIKKRTHDLFFKNRARERKGSSLSSSLLQATAAPSFILPLLPLGDLVLPKEVLTFASAALAAAVPCMLAARRVVVHHLSTLTAGPCLSEAPLAPPR